MTSKRIRFGWLVVLGSGVLTTGCLANLPVQSDDDRLRAKFAAANQERDEHAAQNEARGHQQTEDKNARLIREDAARARAREERIAAAKAEKDAAVEAKAATECPTDRAQREAGMKRRMDSVAHVNELIDWENTHCHFEDNSVEVKRVVQDSVGEYHTVAGRSRGVERVCNAKKPKELEGQYADSLILYRIPAPVDAKNEQCKKLDVAVSPTAVTFWAEQ